VIAKSADRANRLTADLQLAQQQDSQVSQRQQQLQAESAVLQTDKLDAERKLRALQMQVEQLQKQTEAGLAPVSMTPSR
jgi:predicted  nucleic acid-binding Zn-ribbon protein